jgi:hypothetical protein
MGVRVDPSLTYRVSFRNSARVRIVIITSLIDNCKKNTSFHTG